MTPEPVSEPIGALVRVAQETPGLELLLLFGSRARADFHPSSDWDLGYVGSAHFDSLAMRARIVETLGTDRVDLVDLARASGLLRYRVARDGRLLFEMRPGLGDRFRLEAAQFWCDVAPILERGYEEVLAELTR